MDPQVVARDLLPLDYGEDTLIPANQLELPEKFQRRLKPRTWETFIPALFDRIIVAEVNGHYYIVDGQHRFEHGVRHGMFNETPVPCTLHRGCTEEGAAAIFHLKNSAAVALRPADEFRAACYSGDERKRNLDGALLRLGLDGWCQGRAIRDCTAIGSVVVLDDNFGLSHTIYTVSVIGDIWPWDPSFEGYAPGSPHVRCIRGFGQFLRPTKRVTGKRYPRRWHREHTEIFVNYMQKKYPDQEGLESILALAEKAARGGGGGGGSLGMELVLTDCFRRAKRQAQKVFV